MDEGRTRSHEWKLKKAVCMYVLYHVKNIGFPTVLPFVILPKTIILWPFYPSILFLTLSLMSSLPYYHAYTILLSHLLKQIYFLCILTFQNCLPLSHTHYSHHVRYCRDEEQPRIHPWGKLHPAQISTMTSCLLKMQQDKKAKRKNLSV